MIDGFWLGKMLESERQMTFLIQKDRRGVYVEYHWVVLETPMKRCTVVADQKIKRSDVFGTFYGDFSIARYRNRRRANIESRAVHVRSLLRLFLANHELYSTMIEAYTYILNAPGAFRQIFPLMLGQVF